MTTMGRPYLKEEWNSQGKPGLEQTIAAISTRLANASDLDGAINQSLRDLGTVGGAGRAYLFLIRAEEGVMDNTHEWCRAGVTPQKDTLQNLSLSMFPWWMERLVEDDIICIEDVDKLPPIASSEKQHLVRQGIKALLCLPIKVNHELAGFIGFDNVENTGKWSKDNRLMLRLFAELLGNALEKRRAAEALREAELERERCRNRFIQTAAHELRNPMGGIKGLLSLLRVEAKKCKGMESLLEITDLMEREIDRLSELLNELLEAFRVQEDRISFSLQPVRLSDVVYDAAQTFYAIKGDRFRIVTPSDAHTLIVMGDKTRLEEVVRNLLSNAVKFSPSGGIEIVLRRSGRFAVVSVSDQGIGVPQEQTELIFEPFFRARNLLGRDPGGFGLGLYICRDIVERHGGRIWLQSVEGRGSTFFVELPLLEEGSVHGGSNPGD